MASEAAPLSPTSRRHLSTLCVALLANAFAMSNPFPYAAFMVVHLGAAADIDSAGFTSGLIMSSFMIGRAAGSYPLGLCSDLYGRRPVIEIGLWSCVIFQLAFGMAPNFALACLARFFMGLGNGIIGVSKAWLPELVPAERQPFAMSLIAGMWGLGQVIGPACGGVLAKRGFDAFPYLLPNLVGAVLSAAALVAVRAALPRGGGSASRRALCCPAGLRRAARERAQDGGTSLAASDSAAERAAEMDAAPEDDDAVSAESQQRTAAPGDSAMAEQPARAPSSRVLRCLGVPGSSVVPVLVYCLHSFATIFYDEVFPLWLVAPRASGGLGWESWQVGVLLAAGGLFLALAQFVAYPWLARRLSSARLFKGCEAILIGVVLLTPLLPLTGPVLVIPLLVLTVALVRGLGSCSFTACFLIINDSCDKEERGRVNGLGMALSSAFKAAGPALGAVCFAWSITNGMQSNALLDVHFAFFLCGLMAFGTLVVAHLGFKSARDNVAAAAAIK